MPNLNIDFSPNKNNLSLEAYGLLASMLNVPENDYRTAEEYCNIFHNDSSKTVRDTLDELLEAKYIICLKNRIYAVNKLRIPQMKLV